MFFSNPVLDMQITILLLIISTAVSLAVWAISRKSYKSLVVFSVLANLSFLLNIESRMFVVYHISFLQYFILPIWPIVNIILLINYFTQNKNAKNK